MDKHHKNLCNDKLFFQSGEIVEKNIVSFEKQIFILMGELAVEKRKILAEKHAILTEKRLADFEEQASRLDAVIKFYDHAIEKLVMIGELCHKYLVNMKIDLLSEVKDRLQPPNYISMTGVRKAYKKACRRVSDASKDTAERCQCTWTNVSPFDLENALDIQAKPKRDIPTEFDESDLKFKQEIIALRTKTYVYHGKRSKSNLEDKATRSNTVHVGTKTNVTRMGSIETLKDMKTMPISSVDDELKKVKPIKFVDGDYVPSDNWEKILDTNGIQLRSNWYFFVSPQISKILKHRYVPYIHLDPFSTFNYLMSIHEDVFSLIIFRDDIIALLNNPDEGDWLRNWRRQFKSIEGKNIAATFIQANWKGYRVRKQQKEDLLLHFAAYELWIAWLALKKRRERHNRYLADMLESSNITRELYAKLRLEFQDIIQKPHVVIHIPSLGYPEDIRVTFDPNTLAYIQNTMSLRISFLRNDASEVIYVSPVTPNDNLTSMNQYILNSVTSHDFVNDRLTCLPLSEAKTFERRSFNVARLLHCSEETMQAIRQKVNDKPAYILPWIVDECDIKVASTLGIPILGPELDLQRELLNASRLTEIIDDLDLPQPPHVRDIRDYESICSKLAQLIVMNPEICFWLIKLNIGTRNKHYARFLINHVSVPFMPLLRRERDRLGDKWYKNKTARAEFYETLRTHLPKVVSMVSRLSSIYGNWNDFYAHVQKYGCLLQAVPNERNSSIVCIGLFIPDISTGDKARWIGTANKLSYESGFLKTSAYLIPHGTVDESLLLPLVNKFTDYLQGRGFFGYLTLECYCYTHKAYDKLMHLLIDVHPYYSHAQVYIDWIKFAVGGTYNPETITMDAEVQLLSEAHKRKQFSSSVRSAQWNETTDRFAVVVPQLYHTNIVLCKWTDIQTVLEKCEIRYNTVTKEGIHLLLYDGESKSSATLIVISPSMSTSLSIVRTTLKRLYKSFTVLRKKDAKSNLIKIRDIFSNFPATYYGMSKEVCH